MSTTDNASAAARQISLAGAGDEALLFVARAFSPQSEVAPGMVRSLYEPAARAVAAELARRQAWREGPAGAIEIPADVDRACLDIAVFHLGGVIHIVRRLEREGRAAGESVESYEQARAIIEAVRDALLDLVMERAAKRAEDCAPPAPFVN
jgi:hypothetical protein